MRAQPCVLLALLLTSAHCGSSGAHATTSGTSSTSGDAVSSGAGAGTTASGSTASGSSSSGGGSPQTSTSSGSGGAQGTGGKPGTDGGGGCPFAASAAALGLVDGCSAAPAGALQQASLLDGYGNHRPPWDVAGVDYHVGVPGNVTLKDPTAGTLPSCASYDASSHVVTVTASQCTIDGYDFTKGGGLQLSIPSGISGTTVTNDRFGLSGNPQFSTAVLDRRGGDLTVRSCTFQGTGQDPMYFDTGASGTVTFEYDYFFDVDGDGMDFGSSQTVIVQYNACVQIGMAAGSHPDCVQLCGGNLNAASHESFNLSYQPVGVVSAGAQGIQVSQQCGGTVDGYSADHNTVIAADASNLTMSYSVYNNGSNVGLTANYIDSTGAFGPFYPSGDATCTGNVALTGAHGYAAGAPITGTFGTMTCK